MMLAHTHVQDNTAMPPSLALILKVWQEFTRGVSTMNFSAGSSRYTPVKIDLNKKLYSKKKRLFNPSTLLPKV